MDWAQKAQGGGGLRPHCIFTYRPKNADSSGRQMPWWPSVHGLGSRDGVLCPVCVPCVLCVHDGVLCPLSEARTWRCPAPRMGGLDHGPGGPVRLKLKRSNQTKDGNQRHCRYIWRCPVTKMGCFDQRTLGRPGKMACE